MLASSTGIFYTQCSLPLSWPGIRVNEVDQSCFKSFTGLRSCFLNQAPAREFVEKVTTMGNTANKDMTIRQQAFHQPNPWHKQLSWYPLLRLQGGKSCMYSQVIVFEHKSMVSEHCARGRYQPDPFSLYTYNSLYDIDDNNIIGQHVLFTSYWNQKKYEV